jgi:hypothetical protein
VREFMRRSSFITASLACLLWSAGVAIAAEASEAPGASNIGFVLYTRSLSPGTLNARWLFTDEYDLLIEKTGDVYKVTWITNGKVGAVGIGMEVDNALAVGWRRVGN